MPVKLPNAEVRMEVRGRKRVLYPSPEDAFATGELRSDTLVWLERMWLQDECEGQGCAVERAMYEHGDEMWSILHGGGSTHGSGRVQ
jgi:hypothetical protein